MLKIEKQISEFGCRGVSLNRAAATVHPLGSPRCTSQGLVASWHKELAPEHSHHQKRRQIHRYISSMCNFVPNSLLAKSWPAELGPTGIFGDRADLDPLPRHLV